MSWYDVFSFLNKKRSYALLTTNSRCFRVVQAHIIKHFVNYYDDNEWVRFFEIILLCAIFHMLLFYITFSSITLWNCMLYLLICNFAMTHMIPCSIVPGVKFSWVQFSCRLAYKL